MRRIAAGIAVTLLAMLPSSAGASGSTWDQWQSVPGVFDLGGPRSDGTLLVAGSAALYTMTPSGAINRFASGYHDDAGGEPYLAVSPGLGGPGCEFAKDETYVLRLHAPIGVTRVSAAGDVVAPFANVDLSSLNGIAFDTTGSFDHRLLVTGGAGGKTELAAIDCTGAAQVITKTAPVVEGGVAVAPTGFGIFGGSLIAPDELSGIISAISSDGTSHEVVASGLPHGGDIGVESLGFVPPGFTKAGGAVYYSDRATPGNAHPGTDHVLLMSSTDLVAAGVRDGDLLAATEGGAEMIDVRCDVTCEAVTIVDTPTTAHGEGHLGFALNKRPPPAAAAVPSAPAVAATSSVPLAPFVALGASILAALAVLILVARRPRNS